VARKQWRRRRRELRAARRRHWKPFSPRQHRARLKLRQAGAFGVLRSFCAAQPAGAFRPDYADLWFLYRMVRQRRPTVLLEFGSGCSTAVLAAAVEANGEGHVWSVDTMEEWASVTEAAMPARLRPRVTVTRASAVEDDRDVPGWSHDPVPDVDPDFLYLDSPALDPDRAVAFDPLDLESRFKPGFVMVIDGRWRNAEYLRRHFKRRYRYGLQPGRHIFTLEE
jgi:methyltransferase family protein